MKVAGVIQARMGSSRLPGKALLDLAGRPLVWHMIDRLRRVPELDSIVLATTADPRNQALIDLAEREGVHSYCVAAEDDLAARIAGAARLVSADYALRIAGDCPLIDPTVLSGMIRRALEPDKPDFVSNRIQWSFPLGLSADVISLAALDWCDKNLVADADRELFALWIRDHPDRFKVVPFRNDIDLSHYGWTVDEPTDAILMKDIFSALYKPGETFGLDQVLRYLTRQGDPD